MIRLIAGIVVCCFMESSAWARKQQLVYDQDVDVYKLSWDDARISEVQMREIGVLSPFVDFSPQFEIGVTAVRSPAGKIVRDKSLLAPALELCIERPGNPCDRDPENPDARYLKNAEHNLQDAGNQLERLRTEKLPEVLEPVRAYLLEHLQLSIERERVRYEYLSTGDPAALRELLCRECSCTANDETLIERLRTESDPRKRLGLSRFDWNNRVLECESKRRPATYPMDAWQRFVREFGIGESRSVKQID